MTGDDIGRILYLVLLAAAIGGWFISQNRNSWGKNMQQAAVWGLIFMGVIAVVGLWSDIRHDMLNLPRITDETIELPRARDGHFYVPARVNGVMINFVVDTGATNIVLSREDAAKVGFDPDRLQYLGQAYTANGVTGTARVTLDNMTIGSITDTDLRAFVNEGDLFGSLMGMEYLNRFAAVTISGDTMILTR